MGKECIFLEYRIQLAFIRRKVCNVCPIENDRSFVRIFKASQNTEGSRFAAAAWAEEGEKFILSDIEIQIVQN